MSLLLSGPLRLLPVPPRWLQNPQGGKLQRASSRPQEALPGSESPGQSVAGRGLAKVGPHTQPGGAFAFLEWKLPATEAKPLHVRAEQGGRKLAFYCKEKCGLFWDQTYVVFLKSSKTGQYLESGLCPLQLLERRLLCHCAVLPSCLGERKRDAAPIRFH